MRIVHISDFHIAQNNIEDLRNYVIKPLLEDLSKANVETAIDLVVFSGDLVDKAGASFGKDIELAFFVFQEEVIEPIMDAINLPIQRFFFIPGNHDVVRTEDLLMNESGLKSMLKSSEDVNAFIDAGGTDGIKRVLPFKAFEKEFYQGFDGEYYHSNFNSNFKWKIGIQNVGITCFNSSWRCYDSKNDKKNIILGERQITRSREYIEECDIKIGILHHPLDEFADFEAKQIEGMLIKDYDILLFGHVHEASNWSKSNMHGSTITSVSPSNWSTNVRNQSLSFANGYSIIDYKKGETAVINHRRYSHLREEFVANTELGSDSESGKTFYELPSTKEAIKRDTEYSIIEKIKEVHLNALDQHLISYETDTIAPKKVEDIFVLPRIVQKEEEKVNEEVAVVVETIFTIEDICGYEENLLLVGAKEAGKTILMDRILLEITDSYSSYRKIPVYINFEEVQTNRIETIISRYLNIGIHEVKKEILQNYNLVLLIDNIKFDNKYKTLLRNLEEFLTVNPAVSVIATCTTNTEGEVPVEALNQTILELFKPAFIKGFKTKEIRQLMEKWFSGNRRFLDRANELERLIKTLSSLNISRTPLAISMFLWIIEKQENYAPVNNTQMLENFLERLLSKTAGNEVYSADFNYKNKDRLLTEIALEMYGKNQLNYRLTYQDIRNFIHTNLKVKKFDFNEETLLQYFIQTGIFTVEKEGMDRFVKFKFACFFQFFLMKNIDKDKAFKEHVLSEENYLHFVDELDYYSGLNIDDVDLLKLTVDRMFSEYSDFLTKIESIQHTYDNPFETLNTLTKQLTPSDIEKVTSNEHKQTEDDLDRVHDQSLSEKHDTKIIKKDNEIHPFTRLERLWILAAKVLKNTEEIKEEHLKTEAFTKIMKCSIAFATIYKHILIKHLENKDNDEQNKEQFNFIGKFLPVIHQVLLYQTMGTGKLTIVLQEKIEEIIEDESSSDLEKFLCVFIYADLKGKHKVRYINQLIKNSKRYYIKDMIFMKLMEYYFRKDTTKPEEEIYKNLLGDLLTKDDGQSNEKRDFHKKGRFIAKIEKSKQEKILLNTMD